MKNDIQLISDSPQRTIEIGEKLGAQLKGGEIIGFYGTLGTGKTHLIKGIAAGAGAADKCHVNSPTFVIVNEYLGRLDIYHIDAYRLDSLKEFELIGFDDFCYPGSVVLIEWADKIDKALKTANFFKIVLSHTGDNSRTIHIENCPEYIDF